MTLEQRVAVLEEIFLKLQDYYMSTYSGEEIDALLASAGVPIGITKEYDSVSSMNSDFSRTDVTRGQFVLILPSDTSSEDYGKVYLKGSANWVYVFTLTSLTAIKGPQGPAGKTGAKGADGADGKNFMVLGYYETLSALNAAVPSPGTGDTYGVGTEPPYAFYMYDPTISNWRYVGNLQGPAGPTGGEDNFVRYDASQALTDAQKTQARSNINAAPGGYGYGEQIKCYNFTSERSAILEKFDTILAGMGNDTTKQIQLYDSSVSPSQTACSARITKSDANNASVSSDFDENGQAIVYRKKNGTWLPVEYVNPPLAIGVEYRTTERYLANYCTRLVDTDGIEYWASPSMPDWHSAGKVIAYNITAGGNITVPLGANRTYFLACCDNVRKGLVAVQTAGNSVLSITPIIPLYDWSVTLGTGLTVIVTETDSRYGMKVAMTCLY